MLTHGVRALVALGAGLFLIAGPRSFMTGAVAGGFDAPQNHSAMEIGVLAGVGLLLAGVGLLFDGHGRARIAGAALVVGAAGVLPLPAVGNPAGVGMGLLPLLFAGPAAASAILASVRGTRVVTRLALGVGAIAGSVLTLLFAAMASNGLPDGLVLTGLVFATVAGLIVVATDTPVAMVETDPAFGTFVPTTI